MDTSRFKEVSDALEKLAVDIANAKRPGYTQGNSDVLHNFKSSAAKLGITPLQAWGVHFDKHLQAIFSAAKDPSLPQAENLLGRFADAHNYLLLGLALLVDEQDNAAIARASQQTPPPLPANVIPFPSSGNKLNPT